ncbi:MAG: M23 family metallopeptidase [Clostridiales bacterium]|nr:M23 family metallopeptidase [Clostridiales bacterium]
MKRIRKWAADGLRAAWPVVRRLWDRFGYVASLGLLLLLIGAAAYAYRSRPARRALPVPTATPEPAVLSSVVVEPEEEDETIAWSAPLLGEVIGEYLPDELTWSETLEQWQTHAGVDIRSPLGTAVAAAADGTVKEAYRDALLGNVVVLQHAGGYETVYASLQSPKLAEPGASVKQGDIIGAVGNSADLEQMLGAHLHFEMLLNGERVFPEIDWGAEQTDAASQ